MKQTVAAVVVTHNRKELLVKCLRAILDQTYAVDRIFVIDNASSDGTPQMLESLGFMKHPQLEYIRLTENIGGAGGFHEGMKLAYDRGFDWIWLMDDDGFPYPTSLENLMNMTGKYQFLGPLAVADSHNLSFSLPWRKSIFPFPWRKSYISRVSEAEAIASDGCIVGHIFIFNGTLISRQMVATIGYPKKEFFIWGDEIEYRMRAVTAGYLPVTVCAARHHHPPNSPSRMRNIRLPMRLGWVAAPEDKFRLYLYVRNHSYIYRRYVSFDSVMFYVKYLSLAATDYKRSWIIMMALFDGLVGYWGRAKKFQRS